MRSYERTDSSPPRGSRQPRNLSPSYHRSRDESYSVRSADRQYPASGRYDRDRRRSNSPERRARHGPRSPESSNSARSNYESYKPSYGDRGFQPQTRDWPDARDSPRRTSTHDDGSTSQNPQLASRPPPTLLDSSASYSSPLEHGEMNSRTSQADTITPTAKYFDISSSAPGEQQNNQAVAALVEMFAELSKQITKKIMYTQEHESARKNLEEHQLDGKKSESYYSAYPSLAEQKKAGLERAEKAYQSVSQKLQAVETEMEKTATLFATKIVKNIGAAPETEGVELLQAKCNELEKAYENLKMENEEQKKELLSCKEDFQRLKTASDAQKNKLDSLEEKLSAYVPSRIENMDQSLQQVHALVHGPESELQQLRVKSQEYLNSLESLRSSVKDHLDIVKSTNSATSDLRQIVEPLKSLPIELTQINIDMASLKDKSQQQADTLSNHAQTILQQNEKLEYHEDNISKLTYSTIGKDNTSSMQNLLLASLGNENKYQNKLTEVYTTTAALDATINPMVQELRYLRDHIEAQPDLHAKVDVLEEKLVLLSKDHTNSVPRDTSLPSNGIQTNSQFSNTAKETSSVLVEQKLADLDKQFRSWVSDAETEKDALAGEIQALQESHNTISTKTTKLSQKIEESDRNRVIDRDAVEQILDRFDDRISSVEIGLEKAQTTRDDLPNDREENIVDHSLKDNSSTGPTSHNASVEVGNRIDNLEQNTAAGINSVTTRLVKIETDLYHPMNNFGTRMAQFESAITSTQNDIEGLSMSYRNLDGRVNNINTRDLANHIFAVMDQSYPQMKDVDNRLSQLYAALEDLRLQVQESGRLGGPGTQRFGDARTLHETRTMTTNSLREQSQGPSRQEMDDFTRQLVLLRRAVREIQQGNAGSVGSSRIRSNLKEGANPRSGLGSRQPSSQRSGSESSVRRVMSGTPNVGPTQKPSSNVANGAQDEDESHPEVSLGEEDSDDESARPRLS